MLTTQLFKITYNAVITTQTNKKAIQFSYSVSNYLQSVRFNQLQSVSQSVSQSINQSKPTVNFDYNNDISYFEQDK